MFPENKYKLREVNRLMDFKRGSVSYPKRVIFLSIYLLIHGGNDDLETQDDATVRIPKEYLD